MATTKNTADLLAQAVSTLPDNTTQQISPLDVREMDENIAQSSYNKITDSGLVGLKEYSTLPTYESGQGCIVSGKVYISNKVTGPGAFASGDWDLYDELTAAEKTKLGYLTVTAGADLDQMQTDIAALDGARINKGTFDQSLGVFPGGGTAQDGWTWIAVGVSTTIDGLEINPNDAIVAIVDNASTATASDWHLQDNTDKVISVNSQSGAVVLTKTDIGLSNVPNTDFTTAVGLNTAKVTNVSTNLSSSTTSTEVTVASSDGLDVVLTGADSSDAGILTSAKFDEIGVNNGKISNATHTSEVTGSTALTVAPLAVSNKTLITASGAMEVLVNDAGVLKKVVASDFLGGSNIYTTDGTLTAARTVTMSSFGLSFEGGQTTFKGSGSTAGTTALLVENSSGTDLLTIKDDGESTFNGLLNVNGATNSYMDFKVGGASRVQFGFLAGAGYLYTPPTYDFDFYIGSSSPRGTYFSNGNLRVGTGADSGYKLQVVGTSIFGGDVVVSSGETKLIGTSLGASDDALIAQNSGLNDLFKVKNSGTLNAPLLSTYADDTAAGVGGLVANDIYKTATGELRIKL